MNTLFSGRFAKDKEQKTTFYQFSKLNVSFSGEELPDNALDLRKNLGKAHVIFATPSFDIASPANSNHLTICRAKEAAQIEESFPFDIRNGALAAIGDIVKGTPLEVVIAKVTSIPSSDKPGTWVRPGVAEYRVGGYTFGIDIDHGLWPIYHSYGSDTINGAGERSTFTRANLSLRQFDGTWVPSTLIVKSNAMDLTFEFSFTSITAGVSADSANPFAQQLSMEGRTIGEKDGRVFAPLYLRLPK